MTTSNRNQLNDMSKVELWDWLRFNKRLVQELRDGDVASHASASLGFMVTKANVANALEALKITRKKPGEALRPFDVLVGNMVMRLAALTVPPITGGEDFKQLREALGVGAAVPVAETQP